MWNYSKIWTNWFYFRLFVIPIGEGKEDRYIPLRVSVQPDSTQPSVRQPKKRRTHENDK